jgi:predicted outer membrane repeat protein
MIVQTHLCPHTVRKAFTMLRYTARVATLALLLLLTVSLATAQVARPLPSPAARGASHPAAPFQVPAQVAPLTRGSTYIVTTTADRDNGSCIIGDLSLREALGTFCTSDSTVYVPAGTYELDDEILVAYSNMVVIGEDPLTTIIRPSPLARNGSGYRLMTIAVADSAFTIANLTFQNGAAEFDGGALAVSGSGSFSVHNSIFEANAARSGGAIMIDDSSTFPVLLTITESTFTGNTANVSGGAVYLNADQSLSSSILVQDSVFTSNQAMLVTCDGGGGALGFRSTAVGGGGSLTIDNTEISDNSFVVGDCDGAGVYFSNPPGGGTVNISYSEFVSNTVVTSGSYGGGLYAYSPGGTLNISQTLFMDNAGGFGGGVLSEAMISTVISDSLFLGNTADNGAGLYATDGGSISIFDSDFHDNVASADGGGAWLNGDVTLSDSDFTRNTSVNGGGIYLFATAPEATVLNTVIEENFAFSGPDCWHFGDNDVVSLGGSGMTSTKDCAFVPDQTDQFDNMLRNGGFEAKTAGLPSFWSVSNASGDKRACYEFGAAYGMCEFVFKGGADGDTLLKQNVKLTDWVLTDGMTLTLFAEGEGSTNTNLQVQAKATYTNTALGKSKTKLKFIGSNPFYQPAQNTMNLIEGDLSKLQVKIKDKSPSGKAYLDRVYLYAPVSLDPRSTSAPLPLPAVPDGFRGGN